MTWHTKDCDRDAKNIRVGRPAEGSALEGTPNKFVMSGKAGG